ncbi:trypsin-like peptidase domain-containing protein [Pseudonocardia acaciae]|uniref:nSTAND1 domain-containing NTPase n=1 Tax=Pseudonocardia acaciae TaxID=551276 RepID=UPI000AD231C1|nr:trypsin-like peptidase domain-containing protein [Pseudonocardia acaciae]
MRVLTPGGEVVGAGFLIGPDLVGTCAHVVADAAASDPYAPLPPRAPVRVDLPLVHGSEPLRARVRNWSPIRPDGTGDVAVLRLERPVPGGARMPPLRRVDALWDHGFRVLGFPEGQADGVWATGRIRGEQGTRWFQLQAAPGEQGIVEGFSGSPVWDEDSGAVVGMTVAADRRAESGTAYLIPIEQVLGVDPELLPCPYRGLEPFGEEHAAFFFGRDPDIERLLAAVAAQPLVAVAGPSGVGKSSLVRAGLLPRRRDAGVRVADLRVGPGTVPAAALAAALIRALRPGLAPNESAAAVAGMVERLRAPDPSARARAVRELVGTAPGPGVLLFVDQFEELAATQPGVARELLLLVVELVETGRLRAVLTVRWESLTDLMAPAAAAGPLPRSLDSVLDAGSALVAGTVLVGPMDRTRLRDTVVGPARRAPGLSFEPGLVDRILDDAGTEPGQLPLVESLLTQLWERRSGGYLTLAAYHAAGGVAGALAARAEHLLAQFRDPAEQYWLRRLLTQLTQPDRDGRFVRRPVPMTEIPPEARHLVPRLAAGRLVVTQHHGNGGETVELAHQALVEHWPRLRAWLAEDRDFLAWRAQLDQQRERWERAAHDAGALLRGTALAAAQQWMPTRGAEVSPASQDYVRRSVVRQRREVRRWRVVTAVLAVLVLAAGALTVTVTERGNRLEEQLRAATAGSLGREALAVTRTDPELGSRLALAAWHADPNSLPAREALAVSAFAMRSVTGVHPDITGQRIARFRQSANGDTMVATDLTDHDVVLTGLTGPQPPRRWDLPAGSALIISGDGSQLLAPGFEHGMELWDVRTQKSVPLWDAPKGSEVHGFSPDGERLAWLGPSTPAGRQLTVWDTRTRTALPHTVPPVPDGSKPEITPTTDPDTILFATALAEKDAGTRVVARSLSTGAEKVSFPAPAIVTQHGRSVVSCDDTNPDNAFLTVWQAASGAELRRIPLRDSGQFTCKNLRITADRGHVVEERWVLPESNGVAVRVIRLADGMTYDTFVPAFAVSPRGWTAGFRPVEDMGVASGADGPVLLLVSGRSVLRLATTPEPSWEIKPVRTELGADGSVVVAYNFDRITTFDRRSGRRVASIPVSGDAGPAHPQLSEVEGDLLSFPVQTEQGLRVDTFRLPGLDPVSSYPLPPSQAGSAEETAIAAEPGRLYALSDGKVSLWDTARGVMIGVPVPPDGRGGSPRLAPRPQHPGQVAIMGPDHEVQLWDLPAQRLLQTLRPWEGSPAGEHSIAFNHDGSQLATLVDSGTLQVWDVGRHELAHPPIPVPTGSTLIGIAADGTVLIQTQNPLLGYRATFWSPSAGRQVGSIGLAYQQSGKLSTDGATLTLDGVGGVPPSSMAITPQQWRDDLCKFAGRPFPAGERSSLPADVGDGSPCG